MIGKAATAGSNDDDDDDDDCIEINGPRWVAVDDACDCGASKDNSSLVDDGPNEAD